jgi:hypothetical protein
MDADEAGEEGLRDSESERGENDAAGPSSCGAAASSAAAAAAAAATLPECLALLRGPSDERRLVGLLLVTRLLSAQDEATLEARSGRRETPRVASRARVPPPL